MRPTRRPATTRAPSSSPAASSHRRPSEPRWAPLAIVAALFIAGALLGGAPARAIETATFGLDVAERTEDARLHIPIAAGKTSTGRVLVWNKQTAPLTLRLSVSPATVEGDGPLALGGNDTEPVAWVEPEPEEVELGPEERRVVTIEVHAPRKLDSRTRTVAIVAEPTFRDGETPAVLQRLALTTFLEPDERSLVASLGPFPWIALAVLLVVVTAVVRASAQRRRRAGAPPATG